MTHFPDPPVPTALLNTWMHAVGAGAGLIGVTQSQNDQVVEYGYILRVFTILEFPDSSMYLPKKFTSQIY